LFKKHVWITVKTELFSGLKAGMSHSSYAFNFSILEKLSHTLEAKAPYVGSSFFYLCIIPQIFSYWGCIARLYLLGEL